MTTTILDSTYNKSSEAAYQKEDKIDIAGWKPIQPKGAKLHDPETGFDAAVFKMKQLKKLLLLIEERKGKNH
ncbi:hypothetical protein COJ48_06105 [Bacillus cereus]|nr:hypothetical protein COJ48_06105 [Bacillus cereus]PGP84589.1 hypothetical protein CN997_08345 [Bacillus cereus]